MPGQNRYRSTSAREAACWVPSKHCVYKPEFGKPLWSAGRLWLLKVKAEVGELAAYCWCVHLMCKVYCHYRTQPDWALRSGLTQQIWVMIKNDLTHVSGRPQVWNWCAWKIRVTKERWMLNQWTIGSKDISLPLIYGTSKWRLPCDLCQDEAASLAQILSQGFLVFPFRMSNCCHARTLLRVQHETGNGKTLNNSKLECINSASTWNFAISGFPAEGSLGLGNICF